METFTSKAHYGFTFTSKTLHDWKIYRSICIRRTYKEQAPQKNLTKKEIESLKTWA